ncbi:MAG: family 43 glycosylhydrolase [Prevotella sp.]|nr:family 43 glycosylhydrolase [Prevotella sp.]
MKKLLLSLFLSVTLSAQSADYNILDFGATSHLKANSTQALQAAIDRCAADGGGRVVVPAGQYRIGTIVLKSNVHLYLEQGATLYGSTDLKDYRPMKSDYVSLRTKTTTIQLIYADKVKNVTIDGYGTIDGQGRAFKKLSWNDEGITRPHLLRFIQSEDITIKGVTLRNSGCWMQHYLACDRLLIDGIKVFNRNNYNNDALDLDGCHDVIVTNMMADSDDDGITLKSTSPRLCENIRISDCVVSSHCNAVKLGTETNGGFRNINISGIVVKPSENQQEKFFGQWIGSSAISLEIVDGGVLENVNVSDMTVEGTESPIFVRLGNRGRGYLSEGKDMEKIIPVDHIGRIKGVRLDNIQIRNAGSMGCSITGLPGYPVQDVWLSNITLHHRGGVTAVELAHINDSIKDEKEKGYPEATMWGNLPAKGFFVRHARNIQFSNVVVETEQPDVRPDIVRVDTTSLAWGDQGNGTYINPVLNADFSDPDVIRVGEKYYLVASDFHFMGMQVLESDDMVNWRYASQIYSRIDEPGWDENKHYAGGSWAPAIRYHDGLFYVFFCTPEEGLYMSTAKDAHGPWTPLHLVKRVEKWEDPCPFWDEDGQAYLGRSQHGAGPIIVHRMSPDGRQLLDEGVTVYTGPVAEGTKFLKHNGWYYLIIPEGGVGQGWQTVLRARNIYGPYERRVVLEQGATPVNGPHQGALVDTPAGEWWFYHFQETPVLGRVVHLQPACWQDDWLQVGADLDGNGVGEPVSIWQKPVKSQFTGLTLQLDDDFSDSLGLQWQWNHNPDDAHWSLSERKGWLTLRAQPADSLKTCRNMLTQKVVGYQSESTLLLETQGDCYAGLFCSGKQFRGVGLCPNGIFVETNGKRELFVEGRFPHLYLRIKNDCKINSHQFSYSIDGLHFAPLGRSFAMNGGYWKGIRVGLFCYGKDGKAQFDKFEQVILK